MRRSAAARAIQWLLPAALVVALVAAGAKGVAAADAAGPAVPPEPVYDETDRDHWAFRPLLAPAVPEVGPGGWSEHPVDRFLRAAQERKAIEPLPRAGRATLLRRLSFGLTGLPPTPAQQQAFLADDAPGAYERLVDRLLDSPAYGERWAQHWLDVARFAETDGFEHDLVRPNAWRYRDWVIEALNRDVPYDEFVRLQLAGDELYPDDPQAAVATGFLLSGPDMPDLNLIEERRHVVLNEMAATVGSVFLGLQVGCAQCHDHKYDPVSQYDFYRLRAFFAAAEMFRDHPIPSLDERAAFEAAQAAWTPENRARDQRRRELEAAGRERFRESNPDVRPSADQWRGMLSDQERDELDSLVEQLAQLPALPELPLGRVLRGGKPQAAFLYLRGDFRQQGPQLDCGLPQVFWTEIAGADGQPPASAEDDAPLGPDSAADDTRASHEPGVRPAPWSVPEMDARRPRASLARWLTQADHPLTARVMVNRVWHWHFGRGLSATPSDFGLLGDEPTHGELLDWLARQFVDEGWSLKRLHRLLVTSEAYRAASSPYDPAWSAEETRAAAAIWEGAVGVDPENALLWRRVPLRLDGEALRDAMLAAGGRLSPRRGGPGVRPPLPPEVTVTLLKNQWNPSGDKEDHRRRSIYLFVRRNLRFPLFDVFDRPDTNASCAVRHESTTATQSLVLLNSEFSLDCARHLAGAALADGSEQSAAAGELSAAIGAVYRRVYARSAATDEVRQAASFLDAQRQRLRDEGRGADQLALPAGYSGALGVSVPSGGEAQNAGESAAGQPVLFAGDPWTAAAWVDLCLALLNSHEFVYLD